MLTRIVCVCEREKVRKTPTGETVWWKGDAWTVRTEWREMGEAVR